jgi:phosphoglycolate phosphatase-like HAD superfamily hydrolase
VIATVPRNSRLEKFVIVMMKTVPKDCYVFDIDGTLADASHRLHHIARKPKDWRAFFAASADDKAIEHICDLARHLSKAKPVVFVSGRSDEVREETEDWLERETGLRGPLYMRNRRDRRPDYIVKAELLDRLQADGYRPIMAFDDRDQVVKMWRAKGVPCAQVAEGNF